MRRKVLTGVLLGFCDMMMGGGSHSNVHAIRVTKTYLILSETMGNKTRS
jgi:hypothetical protein